MDEYSVPHFTVSVTVNGIKYQSVDGFSKIDGKARAAIVACDALGLYHTGVPVKSKSIDFLKTLHCVRAGRGG